MELPKGHQDVMPYYIIPDAHKFHSFLKEVFEAKELQTYLNDDGSIMHAEVQIGKSTLMFGNSDGQWKPMTSSVFVYVENVDKTFAKALKEGAVSLMEPEDKDYGRSCGLKDSFGNTWWLTENK